jgi:hypothetical protein
MEIILAFLVVEYFLIDENSHQGYRYVHLVIK